MFQACSNEDMQNTESLLADEIAHSCYVLKSGLGLYRASE